MKFQLHPRLFVGVLFSLILLLAGCSSGGRKPYEAERQPQPRVGSGIKLHTFTIVAPVIRVGLIDKQASTLTIQSEGGMVLLDGQGRRVHSQKLHHISLFIRGFNGVGPQTVYRVQVGSFSSEGAATRLADTLRGEYRIPVVTPYNSQTRTWRVQIGQFSTRADAGNFQARLRGDGRSDSLIVQDKTPVEHDGELNAISIDGSLLAARKRFILVPAGTTVGIQVADVTYRGAIELRISEEGTILPINIVHLENYLKGVVPAEMSSSVYPQIEALKAQSLAARTYAVRNMGQYADKGFDICNTPACQVYKGMPVEQKMTSAAVVATKGEIITYDGKPINALFTSTSGGHTENVENVFEGSAVPYLRGVPSRPDGGKVRYFSSSGKPAITYDSQGKPLNFKLDILRQLGFSIPAAFAPDEQADFAFVDSTLKRLARIHNGRYTLAESSEIPRLQFYQALVEAMSWQSLVKSQVHQLDVEMVFPADNTELEFYQKQVVLYLLRFDLISPSADGDLGYDKPVLQQELVELAHRLVEAQGMIRFDRGNFMYSETGDLVLEVGRNLKTFETAADVRLYQYLDGMHVPVSRFRAVAGDMMRSYSVGGKTTILVHEPSTQGLTNDRFSKYHHWDVHYSMQELTERIHRYVNVGDVHELQPLRYGVSNRVAELRVIGSTGETIFKGLRIRWALGLRDMLFTILKVHDANGVQTGWRFVGSGWGHGVGLCQVGSYGMALAGANYKEIVKHFYTGVEVTKQ